MLSMGDKIASKKIAREANVNTIPGFLGEMSSEAEVLKIANEIGYNLAALISTLPPSQGTTYFYRE
jgi:propionyl-CoA carboxylase alpha chain